MTLHDVPPPNPSGLLRGAALFVVALAAVFGVIGLLRDETGGTEILDEPIATPEPTPEPSTPSPSDTPSEAVLPTSSPTPSETGVAAGDIAPADISIQVLDGTDTNDGGMARVVTALREGGYNVVAENNSVNIYEQTTVFFTEGNEDAANQVAAQFGYEVVLPKLDNLSDSVSIHVVVGEDA